jgi:hypothetical protein
MAAQYVRLTPAEIMSKLAAGHEVREWDSYAEEPGKILRVDAPTSGGMLGFGAHQWTVHIREEGMVRRRKLDATDTLRIEKK